MSDDHMNYQATIAIAEFEIRNFDEVWGIGSIDGRPVSVRISDLEKAYKAKAEELGVPLRVVIALMNMRIDPVIELDKLQQAARVIFEMGERDA